MKHLKQDMDGYLNIEEIITESNIGNEMIKSKGAKKSGNTNQKPVLHRKLTLREQNSIRSIQDLAMDTSLKSDNDVFIDDLYT